jgi:hypothetical protein
VGTIVSKHADDFNATYEKQDGGMKVIDAARFKEIVNAVQSTIKKDLEAAGLPVNNFMQNALLTTVFELDVLNEVMKVIDA